MDEDVSLSFDPGDPVAARTEAITNMLKAAADLPDDLQALAKDHVRAVTKSIDIEFPQPKLSAIEGGKRSKP